MNWFKRLANDFPTQGGGTVVALALIFMTGLVVIGRLALGKAFPPNYDTWLWILVALAWGSTAGMIGKRATDHTLARIKSHGPSPVNVEAPSDVTVETERG